MSPRSAASALIEPKPVPLQKLFDHYYIYHFFSKLVRQAVTVVDCIKRDVYDTVVRTKRTRQKQKLGVGEYINYAAYSTLGRAIEMSGLSHPHTVLTMSTVQYRAIVSKCRDHLTCAQ